MSVESILQAVESLSPPEQVELIDRLCEKYGDREPPFSESDELLKLLEERDREYEANPTDVYTLEEVIAFVKRKK